MSLSTQFLDELRSRTLLSALIGKSLKLQKAGREYKGCCPFHDEKTPSFYVNDDKGFYHCFGCSAHGDAIRWLTDAKGLPFMDAVKDLAATAGMEVPAADPRAAARSERQTGLHAVTDAAQTWFVEQLGGIAGADARAYLQRRGIGHATQAAFGIGFAPDSRGKLKAALATHGEDALIEAGMLIAVDGKEAYDRFRGRLMIPIRDQRGRAIAFGGRIIGDGEPKYLNSPETPLFDKGRTLFNLDRAGPASRKAARLIVVEGYMDVIALDQVGISETVAPLGTALTEGQLERMWRLAEVPILCFDGDAAGQKAAIRAALRALPMVEPDRSLRFATLPVGQDPDDLVKAGGRGAMEAILATPEPLVDRLWHHEVNAAPLDTPEARAGLRRRLNDHAATIRDNEVRQQYLAEFRDRFDSMFARAPRSQFSTSKPRFEQGRPGTWRPGFPSQPRPVSGEAKSMAGAGIEPLFARAMLGGLIGHPELIAHHAEAIQAIPLGEPRLANVRDALLDAAFRGHPLESGAVETILAGAGLADTAEALRASNGLAFSFLRGNADSGKARRDLAAMIEVLAARPDLEAALAAATRRLMAEPDETAFAEQRRLSRERLKADEILMAIASGDESAS